MPNNNSNLVNQVSFGQLFGWGYFFHFPHNIDKSQSNSFEIAKDI